MKKIKIAVALTCALTMMLSFNLNSTNNTSNQASNKQKTYAVEIVTPGSTIPGVVYPCNDGTPAI